MKKLLTIILTLGLAAGLAGCSGNSKKEEESTSSAADTTVTNPIELVSLDDFEKELGLTINLTDEFTDLEAKTIKAGDNNDQKIYELDFKYDENEYCFRLQKTDEQTDISGMNYEFGEGKTLDTGLGCSCTIYTTEEGQGLSIWYLDGYSFTLSCNENADTTVLFALSATLAAGCTFE